jgi:hypothetical protein
MSGIEGVECEDFDDGEAGVVLRHFSPQRHGDAEKTEEKNALKSKQFDSL